MAKKSQIKQFSVGGNRRNKYKNYLPSRPACFGRVPKMNYHAVTRPK